MGETSSESTIMARGSALPRTALACLLSTFLPLAFGQVSLTTAQIAKRVSPAVVVIEGKTTSGGIQGSGFIISKDGKIATNLHVIKDLNTARVQLADGRIFDSLSVLAVDELRDLAIVKVAGFNLSILPLGNSDTLTVGERVVVVGSPLGLEATVTAGILSAVRDSGEGFKLLQTDAAINHGNSGGPLVSANGLAVGVVSSILRSDAAQGLNFAIPINYVRGLLDNLHDPMTLAQMRQMLVNTKSTARQGAGASLKETLDWLKEKLTLSTAHFVLPPPVLASDSGQQDVTERTIPRHFESCTISFDNSEVMMPEKYPGVRRVNMDRTTVSLGELTDASVSHLDDLMVAPVFPLRWAVVLTGTAKVFLSETWTVYLTAGEIDDNAKDVIKSDSKSGGSILFKDESLARRVAEAFKHAADLCKGREPF